MGVLFLNSLILVKKKPQYNTLIISFALFFFSDFLSLFFSGRGVFENTIINDVKIACAILPFTFYNSRIKTKELQSQVFVFFVIGVFTYILYACLYYIYFIQIHPRYTVQIDNYLFWAIENRFPGTYHRTYVGVYIVFSSILTNIWLFNAKSNKRILWGLLFVFQMIGIFFLGSKLTMVMFLVLNLILILNNFRFLAIPFITCAIVGFYLIKEWVFTSMKKSIQDRLIFFDESLNLINNHLFFGIGERNITKYMVEINKEMTPLIPHNIFLKETLSNGILGLIFLLFLIGVIIYQALKEKNLILNFFIALIITVSLIEDFIYLQRGLFFFIFFTLLMLNFNNKDKWTNEKTSNMTV
ncbi:hypothetical protein BUL40_01430 [Croceivirga radicis]|uniref:O-antigen ligase domain-containing protein n=2 Tax=Croceivirga radicis TaxID=1929488 RepID=A0A1V6LW64_9FLAO|nr:hypothetical protein BUL40_01430 [Croceivirga radicis]